MKQFKLLTTLIVLGFAMVACSGDGDTGTDPGTTSGDLTVGYSDTVYVYLDSKASVFAGGNDSDKSLLWTVDDENTAVIVKNNGSYIYLYGKTAGETHLHVVLAENSNVKDDALVIVLPRLASSLALNDMGSTEYSADVQWPILNRVTGGVNSEVNAYLYFSADGVDYGGKYSYVDDVWYSDDTLAHDFSKIGLLPGHDYYYKLVASYSDTSYDNVAIDSVVTTVTTQAGAVVAVTDKDGYDYHMYMRPTGTTDWTQIYFGNWNSYNTSMAGFPANTNVDLGVEYRYVGGGTVLSVTGINAAVNDTIRIDATRSSLTLKN